MLIGWVDMIVPARVYTVTPILTLRRVQSHLHHPLSFLSNGGRSYCTHPPPERRKLFQ